MSVFLWQGRLPPIGPPSEEIQPFLDRIYLRLRISQRVAVAGCTGSMICLLVGLGNSSEALAKTLSLTSHRPGD